MHRDKAFISITTSLNVSQQSSSEMSARMTWRGIPPPIQRSVGVLGPVLFPIVSVGSSVRQLNAQDVAGPLPKSISSTWHVRPHRQRVLASESSMSLKPSLQGRRASARRRREATGLTRPRKTILWTARSRINTIFAGFIIKWFINIHLIS